MVKSIFMKATTNVPKRKNGLLMRCAFFCFLFITTVEKVVAQASDEPSLQHLKKNTAALREEIESEARRQEILNYVYMVVGLIIVFAVAWFSTSTAKKKSMVKTDHHPKPIHRKGHHPRR
jgi:hypothetical protein